MVIILIQFSSTESVRMVIINYKASSHTSRLTVINGFLLRLRFPYLIRNVTQWTVGTSCPGYELVVGTT